jgi:hypothetical protein
MTRAARPEKASARPDGGVTKAEQDFLVLVVLPVNLDALDPKRELLDHTGVVPGVEFSEQGLWCQIARPHVKSGAQ